MSREATTDTVTLELITGTLRAAREEMEALIDRTAMSPFIREKKDFFTSFLNRDGKLVVSSSLTLSGNLVEGVFQHYPSQTMADGDLYIYNDAYGTGGGVSHLPDMVFLAPVFHDNKLFAFAESWGHLWDIGGTVPGSISPEATSTFQEGVLVPPVKVMAEGVLNEEVFRIFTRNSRFPDMMRGDLKALMAACHLGKRRLEDAMDRFGADAVEDAFEFMLAQSEQALRTEIERRVPDGTFGFRDYIDSDVVTDQSQSVHVSLAKSDGKISLDFSGSADQAEGPINFIMDDSVPKYMCGLYFTMHDPNIRMNAGFERAIDEIIKRPGSLVAPVEPAPIGLRTHTMIRVNSALFGAIAQATGGEASAASSVYVLYYLRSEDRATGRVDLCIEGLGVGFGARTYADGTDAVYYVAQKNYPLEFAEMEFGVEIEAFRIHADSGGPGRWRGGCGIIRDVRVLADDATLGVRLDNCKFPAFGVAGGQSGRPGRIIINPDGPEPYELKSMSDGNRLKKGDLIRVITPGGGGWGPPAERPAESVLDDVLDGFVSIESAYDDYGVVLSADGVSLDMDGTARRRSELNAPTGIFHRNQYFSGSTAESLDDEVAAE